MRFVSRRGPAALVGLLLAIASPAVARPFSDQFFKDVGLNPGWTLSQPNPSSSYQLSSKGLFLKASGANGGSDLWSQSNYNGSLLLQPIAPKRNWTITVKAEFNPTNCYQGAGILLAQQTSGFNHSSVFHRFEYGSYCDSGRGLSSGGNGTRDSGFSAFTGRIVYIMLQKSGSVYTYSYSADGSSWNTVSTIDDPAAYSYVGLISIRQPWDNVTTLDSKPVFKFFKITLQ